MQHECPSPFSQQPFAHLLNPRFCASVAFLNILIVYDDELLATCSNTKLGGPLLVGRVCPYAIHLHLPSIQEATCSIRNPKTRPAVVIGIDLPLAFHVRDSQKWKNAHNREAFVVAPTFTQQVVCCLVHQRAVTIALNLQKFLFLGEMKSVNAEIAWKSTWAR